MQEIFYNGNIVTNNENNEVKQAMMINDESIVYVGETKEVLELKTDETKLHDLRNKWVYPAGFSLKTDIFKIIDEKIKNANLVKKFQNSDEIDEDYENFTNFEIYKKEYLNLEKEYLKKGIATIVETNIDKKCFAFFKKMSEEKLLSIDVVGFIDLINSKQVMDDNCVTYRGYKNHFRLGGYYLKIDGKILELKAWMNKAYAGTKSHYGLAETSGEQLYYLLKTALDEKKQIMFETNGDRAIETILNVFEELKKKEKTENFYRPIFYGASVVPKKLYSKLKSFDVTLLFENHSDQQKKSMKKFIGLTRLKQFYNYKNIIKNGVRFAMVFENNISDELKIYFSKKRKFHSKMLKNNVFMAKNADLFKNVFYINPAYICFDQERKGKFETEKQASFVVFEKDILSCFSDNKLKNVYILGEKKY